MIVFSPHQHYRRNVYRPSWFVHANNVHDDDDDDDNDDDGGGDDDDDDDDDDDGGGIKYQLSNAILQREV